MPFARPTLTTLVRQARTDMAQASDSYTILRSSPLGILATAMAGLVHGLYGYIDWLARQATPIEAEDEFLQAWGAMVGILPKEASQASGTATFAGTVGASIPSGTILARASDGTSYATTAAGIVGSGGTVTVPILAEAAGAGGNAAAGLEVSLATAVSGINSTGSFASTITGGADEEEEDDYRERVLARFASTPQGGARSDYVQWALEVDGVTRAWANPNGAGAGTVVVYVMLDEANSAHGGFPIGTDGVATDESRGTPATGDQLAVADHISPLRPVTALVYVAAPVAQAQAFTITDLSSTNSDTVAAVKTALQDMFFRLGDPTGCTIYPSDWNEAISSVEGMQHFTVSSPTAPVTFATGKLPVLGTITWV